MNPDIPVPETPAPDKGVEIDTGSKPEEINLDPERDKSPEKE